jgi:hypothetical protein
MEDDAVGLDPDPSYVEEKPVKRPRIEKAPAFTEREGDKTAEKLLSDLKDTLSSKQRNLSYYERSVREAQGDIRRIEHKINALERFLRAEEDISTVSTNVQGIGDNSNPVRVRRPIDMDTENVEESVEP